jgi:hypothetical protein
MMMLMLMMMVVVMMMMVVIVTSVQPDEAAEIHVLLLHGLGVLMYCGLGTVCWTSPRVVERSHNSMARV